MFNRRSFFFPGDMAISLPRRRHIARQAHVNANRPKAAESWLEDHDVSNGGQVFWGDPFDSMSFRGHFFFGGINIPSGKITIAMAGNPPFFCTEIHRLIHGVISQPAMLVYQRVCNSY